MKIRSQEVTLALAVIGLLSYAACTAEKTETKKNDVSSMIKPENSTVQIPKQMPKLVEGVFATDDHLQPVYFDLNKAKITDSAMDIVKTNAEWMKTQPPYLIRLVGFADPRGSMKKNERLAKRRGDVLRDAYIALGIPQERMTVVMHTEDPACQPVTEECLSKSRRTETLLEDKSLASR